MNKSKPTVITKFWLIQGPVLALASTCGCILGLCVCSYGFLSTVTCLKTPLALKFNLSPQMPHRIKLHQNPASSTGEGYILCQK